MTSRTETHEPWTCAEVETHLEAYVAGELLPAMESRLAAHLMACPRCAAEVALGERVACELAALPAFDAPPALVASIKASARSEAGSRSSTGPSSETGTRQETLPEAWRSPRWALRPLALAAALVAALGLGWWQRGRLDAPALAPQASAPSAAEIAAGERQARYALALVARLGRRAGEEIRQEVLIERLAVPLARGVGGPLQRAAGKAGGMES